MRRVALWGVALLGLAVLTGCGRRLAPAQTRDLMRRVHQARETACLTGDLTTTVRVGDQTLSGAARLAAGPDHSELTFTSGKYAGWRIVQQDGLVWRVDPRGKPQPGQGGFGGLGLGGANPMLVVTEHLPSQRAGRKVLCYTISPRGKGRARLELAVDAETGYPLGAVRYGTQGQLLSSTVFHTAEFGGRPPARVPVPAVAQASNPASRVLKTRPSNPQALAAALGGPLLLPRRLPDDFTPVGYYLSQAPRGPLAEVRYSDGLRVIVLLQMDLRRFAGRSNHGPTPAAADRPGFMGGKHVFGGGQPEGRGQAGPGIRQALRSRLRGHILRERKGSRLVVLAGDFAPDQLQEVMDSIPDPPGPTWRF